MRRNACASTCAAAKSSPTRKPHPMHKLSLPRRRAVIAAATLGLLGGGLASARADESGPQVDPGYYDRLNSGALGPVSAYALITADSFFAKYNGKYVDVDGAPAYNKYQCWDVFEAYSREVMGKAGISTAYGPHPWYAIALWDGYAQNGASSVYSKVSATSAPRKGDVAIWQWGSRVAPYSHVAIVAADQGSSIKTFGQNAPNGAPASYFTLPKEGLAGYLRRKTVYTLRGAIGARYYADGGAAVYGQPLSNEIVLRDGGCYQKFEKTRIFWKSSTGAWSVRGAIYNKWRAYGGENGRIGYPTGGMYKNSKGVTYQGFEGAVIYWTSTKGAWISYR